MVMWTTYTVFIRMSRAFLISEFVLVLFETTEQAVRIPAGMLTTLTQVSRRFHWSVLETSGILLRLDHVTFLPVPSVILHTDALKSEILRVL